jgi:hypothetical protein
MGSPSPYVAIVRRTGRTEKTRHATLDEALDALERELRVLTTRNRPRTVRALGREYEPEAQVAARGELRGPRRLRAGVDVRGDGAAQAFTGRIVRRPVPPRDGEDAYAALRRIAREAVG